MTEGTKFYLCLRETDNSKNQHTKENKLMSKYFGTDGFRGEANETLTAEHAYKTGRFIGWYYGLKRPDGRAKVVIGKDTRRSSYMFEYALAAGLTASGADAYLCLLYTSRCV